MVTINMCLGRPHKDCIDRALCKLQVSCQVATKVFHSKFSLTFFNWDVTHDRIDADNILQDTG